MRRNKRVLRVIHEHFYLLFMRLYRGIAETQTNERGLGIRGNSQELNLWQVVTACNILK
jgi:hypothetical protein